MNWHATDWPTIATGAQSDRRLVVVVEHKLQDEHESVSH